MKELKMVDNKCARCGKHNQEYVLYYNIKTRKEEFICFKCWELIRKGDMK